MTAWVNDIELDQVLNVVKMAKASQQKVLRAGESTFKQSSIANSYRETYRDSMVSFRSKTEKPQNCNAKVANF